MRVEQIWRFPVKSLGGETLGAARVDAHGIEGDRAWGLYDSVTDRVLTARREPRLLFLSAALDGSWPTITAADGEVLGDDAALSAWLGRPVELRSARDGSVRFEAPMNERDGTDWVSWESTGATFHDGRSKLSVVSRATLGAWDARRFRLNLIVDQPGDDELSGDLAIGSAVVSVRKPIERCIMVTRAQPGLERDLSVLHRVHRERNNRLGIGVVVTTAGTISVGDAVCTA